MMSARIIFYWLDRAIKSIFGDIESQILFQKATNLKPQIKEAEPFLQQ